MSSLRDESIPPVGRRFWIYPAGSGDLDAEEFNATFESLEEEFEPGRPGPVGVCVIVEDREQMERHPEAIWPGTELMFAGYLPDDRQLRIRYLWGATIGPGLPDSPSLDEAMADDHPLEDRYRIEPFAESTTVTKEDVIAVWRRDGVLPGPLARERVQQVQLVAITGEREVAGVSTVYLEHSPQLRMDLWYYRTFVGSPHRHTNVARHLISSNRDLLERRFTAGEDTRAPGMIFELEHEGMKRHLNTALWAHSRFVFIGEDQRGRHIRIHFFPGARVPPPRQAPKS
jgi:hypothetical protein